MQVLGSTSGVGLTSGKTHVQAAGVDLRSLGLTWGGRQVVQTCLMQQRVVVAVVVVVVVLVVVVVVVEVVVVVVVVVCKMCWMQHFSAFSWCLTSLGCMFGDFDV